MVVSESDAYAVPVEIKHSTSSPSDQLRFCHPDANMINLTLITILTALTSVSPLTTEQKDVSRLKLEHR